MRVYKTDGSYVEDNDSEFGWYFYEIMVDEADERFEKTRLFSKLNKKISENIESIDLINFEDSTSGPVKNINPPIEIEEIIEVESRNRGEDESFKDIDLEFPPKEKLSELINPCNTETKMLLSVVNFPRYRALMKHEATNKLMENLNTKSTNYKNLIKDKRTSITEDMVNEIVNYHATKEDTMMSLMMELILTDVDCSLEDIVEVGEKEKNVSQVPQFVIENYDSVNNLPSIRSNKSEGIVRNNYLQLPNRENILSSLGLSEEDKSIQSFCEETFEMHQELADIRKSFQEDADKVYDLLKQASALKNDLRETLYLNDIINLLKGDIEKVKLKKLPFRIFYARIEEGEPEINLII
ncbi:uncharacterized protein LOC130451560 [Diorhabda sublineata]|uniref:uncharacterized protein LOC130451560 n=1 Tax=Diorhabda sublineata TaxID=1163346 RepID=UPI0024E123E5|nr:uncharacterized protein LOC130451560 [Diorhabda sublineata]